MKDNHLHIVSFDIPYPPAYGGIIDVFYKLKALASAGLEITLHAFDKENRTAPAVLAQYCKEVHIYKRDMSWQKGIGTTPFIIASRFKQSLIKNLEIDDAPILLEGMHLSAYLEHPALKNRHVLLRMHNIEWDYYHNLARQEEGWLKKCFYKLESLRLKNRAPILNKAALILAISQHEQSILSQQFDRCAYLPAFHEHHSISALTGLGNYALYHGNLSVVENRKAVEYLIDEVFSDLEFPLKIAGSNPPADWIGQWDKRVEFIINPNDRVLTELIQQAHMNVLVSFQNTGVKLKLINALFGGRHCIVNSNMVEGSTLESLCQVVDDAENLKKQILQTESKEFTELELEKRNEVLTKEFNNKKNASRLIEWLYPHP